jgi:type II secretory pathway component PulK
MIARHRSHGFTYVATLLMLILVTAATSLMAAQTFRESKRLTQIHRRAQLEQLLLAGTREASLRLASVNTSAPAADQSWNIDLPAELKDNGASLQTMVLSAEDNAVTFEIHAGFEGRSLSQTLQFIRADNGWRLASAELNE